LVVTFGLFHGLCLLPVILSLLGPAPLVASGGEGEDGEGDEDEDEDEEKRAEAKPLTNGESGFMDDTAA